MKKRLSIIACVIMSVFLLVGCGGGAEPIQANVGEEISTDAITIQVNKIDCESTITHKGWDITDDKEPGTTGFLVADGIVANKSGGTIPKGAIKATFTYGEQTVDADFRAISTGDTYMTSGEDMEDGKTYRLLCLVPITEEFEAVGKADLTIGFDDLKKDVSGKDVTKLKNIYTLTEENTFVISDLKNGSKATKDGEYELTVKDSGHDSELRWQEDAHYSHSYAIDDYCMFIKLDYKNLDTSKLEKWNNGVTEDSTVVLKSGDYEFDGGFWLPNDIPALGTSPVFVYFNVPKDIAKSDAEKVATFKIGDDNYRYTFK